MLDIKFLRSNPDIVKQNIKNKFQDEKLPLVDEVIELDQRNREIKQEVESLRAEKNKASKQIGAMMAQKKLEEAEALKKKVAESSGRINELSEEEKEVEEKIRKIMMVIPNIIDPSVPIGKDDSENVELERFGDPVVPDFEIPYHTEIMEYDQQRIYLLRASIYDQKQCGHRSYELCRNGRHDVQDRRRRSLSDRYKRAFHDR